MKELVSFDFDYAICKQELRDFGKLLSANRELSERKQLLPFFSQKKHLAAFIGSYFPKISNYNLLAVEYPIYGDFGCDLVVGDSKSKSYCFIEIEDAKKNSIFVKKKEKATFEWAPRFEHGFSQIIDWFWKLEDMRQSADFRGKFGDISDYHGMLIIGRSSFLSDINKHRLAWRSQKVLVNSKIIHCLTLDELHVQLSDRLYLYNSLMLNERTKSKKAKKKKAG